MIIRNKSWDINQIDEDKVKEIKRRVDVSDFLAKILSTRDIEVNEILNFLNPMFYEYEGEDPFLLSDMRKSVNRIIEAISKEEKIVVFGDSDADGLTGTAILYDFLTKIGDKGKIDYYVLNRENGYGLSDRAVEGVLQKKPNLIITVDCGTTDVKAVDEINKKGIDVIITDHHECGKSLPCAYGVINPKRDDEYPFRELAGVGVVLKLVIALCNKNGLDEECYLKYMDRVAVGTLADKVSLTGENREIVKCGMRHIIENPSLGVKMLIEKSLFNRKNKCKKILSKDIVFELAPRLNAGSEIRRECVQLLSFDNIVKNEAKAKEIIEKLEKENNKRKELSYDKSKREEDIENALEKAEYSQLNDSKVIFVGGKKWDEKNLALIANKVGRMYKKPVIAYKFTGRIGRAAARNYGNYNLFDAVEKCKDFVRSFGGHDRESFGIQLEGNIYNFKDNLLRVTEESIKTLDAINRNKLVQRNKCRYIVIEIKPEEITLANARKLEVMEPFGNDNPVPMFLCRRMRVVEVKEKDKRLHLKLTGENDNYNGKEINAVGFKFGFMERDIEKGDAIDFVFEMGEYDNNVQMIIKDMRCGKRKSKDELGNDKKRVKISAERIYGPTRCKSRQI